MTNCCESNNDKIQELLASGGFEPAIPTSQINRLDIWYTDGLSRLFEATKGPTYYFEM